MKVDFKKIIRFTHTAPDRIGFGARLNSKRDLIAISLLSLVLIIISGLYSFGLFNEIDASNNFFTNTSGDSQLENVIDIQKLKEKLDLFNEKNGCIVKFEENISNIEDPSF